MRKIGLRSGMSILLLGGMLGLAACGNGQGGETEAVEPSNAEAKGTAAASPGSNASATSEANPGSNALASSEERILTDDYGREVRLAGTPQRVLAVYLEDPLVALGVKPLLKFNFGGAGGASYLQSYLADVPPAGTADIALTPEQALDVEPDLIIAHSLVTGPDQLDNFAKIAPTYGLDANKSDWRTVLRKVGELLGMSDKAEQVLEAYDARTADAKAELRQAIGGETFALLRLTGKEYRLYGAGELDPFNGELLYDDLGLTPSKLVQEVPEGGGWSLSLEKLPELDADRLILVTNEAGKAQAQEMMAGSLWQNLPAVKSGHVYEVDPTLWLSIGYMANSAKIDDLLARVVK